VLSQQIANAFSRPQLLSNCAAIWGLPRIKIGLAVSGRMQPMWHNYRQPWSEASECLTLAI